MLLVRASGRRAACVEIALGAHPGPALHLVAPLFAFHTAALTLSALVERSGLAQRAADVLAAVARGRTLSLYLLACALCALLTAVVSLDGAVVLMVPLLLVLARRFHVPFGPLFLGVVCVANAASIAVPQGNPTNLLVMNELGISAAAFVRHMLAPGLAATAICVAGVALLERRALTGAYQPARLERTPLSAAERHAALSLAAAAVAAWVAPLLGMAPWWPFSGVVAIALLRRERPEPVVPWRVAVQVLGLVLVAQALGLRTVATTSLALPGLVVIAAGVGAISALANNLPVSAAAATLLAAGPAAYAASIGLAVGALATPHGSVATLIAADLAGPDVPPLTIRRLVPLAAAAVLVATLLLWASL